MSESKFKEYQKAWYQQNKERIAVKQSTLTSCDSCKKNIRTDAMPKHNRSNYHIKRVSIPVLNQG